jgi:16S rRNA (guanine1207-N2)-methyltransferase
MEPIRTTIRGIDLQFRTSPEVFSPRSIDAGTLAMLSVAELRHGDRVLDLGCGYGVVGILAARLIGPEAVLMVDRDEAAVVLARENAAHNGVPSVAITLSDGFRGVRESGFTTILCNPPYHVDFAVPKHFIEKGFNRLALGGQMVLVTKRTLWYRKKLGAIFGGAKTCEISGYTVFVSTKDRMSYANKKYTGRKARDQ